MGGTPLLDPVHMDRAFKVRNILGFGEPTLLTGRFTGRSTFRL
jgi:hypothetical protein